MKGLCNRHVSTAIGSGVYKFAATFTTPHSFS
jgi:hypothetical protein